jgi:NAD(P)-dependent dehydrogenase (short-subunit alcohol dehydrogenase family)
MPAPARLEPSLEISDDQYEADWRVNGLGAFIAAKEVAPAMIRSQRGVMLSTGAVIADGHLLSDPYLTFSAGLGLPTNG